MTNIYPLKNYLIFFKVHPGSDKRMERKQGMLKFNASNQEQLVRMLVTQLNMEHVEKEMPGLPAHILFMSIRCYIVTNKCCGVVTTTFLFQSSLSTAIGYRSILKIGRYKDFLLLWN